MTGTKLIGKKVIITTKDSWAYDEWGIVRMFDGEYYHISIAGTDDMDLIFTRDEFRVPREKRS